MKIENNSIFTNNTIQSGTGGAISNSGTLTTDNALFDSNSAGNDGGAISNSGSLIVSNSTFTGNNAVSGHGGAIAFSFTIQLLIKIPQIILAVLYHLCMLIQ